MSRDWLLALDLGTTRVCALLVGLDGRIAARCHRPLTTRYPEPGRVEQDPEEMWTRSVEVLREALHEAHVAAAEVAALGVVAQRATVLAWETGSGRPLAPAIGWQDHRSAPRVAELRAQGVPITTLPSATKLEWWLRGDEPAGAPVRAALAAGRLRVGTPDAWLTERLTGGRCFVTDPGHASSTALFDLGTGDWSEHLLGLFGVPREALPGVCGTAETVGETPAALLGAPVPVAARAGDQQAAAFAQGTHRPGQAKLTLGTSAMLDVHAGETPPRAPDGAYALALWRLQARDAFCLEGTVITAGAAVDWLVEIGVLPSAAELDTVAARVSSSGGAYLVPAFQGLGTPWLDLDARARLGGLTLATGRGEIARAVLDGIAQRCVDVWEALTESDEALAVDGGLADSALLLQGIADLAGRPLHRAAELETTALGAALLAGLGVGALPDLDACAACVAAPQVFAPRLSANDRRAARTRWQERVAH